jgi:hypothetical protein
VGEAYVLLCPFSNEAHCQSQDSRMRSEWLCRAVLRSAFYSSRECPRMSPALREWHFTDSVLDGAGTGMRQ